MRATTPPRPASAAPTDPAEPGTILLSAPVLRQHFGSLSVREQISRSGGDLTVTTTPGRGALASVRLPLQVSAPPETGDDLAFEGGRP